MIREPSLPLPETTPGSQCSTVWSSESCFSAASCSITVATNALVVEAVRKCEPQRGVGTGRHGAEAGLYRVLRAGRRPWPARSRPRHPPCVRRPGRGGARPGCIRRGARRPRRPPPAAARRRPARLPRGGVERLLFFRPRSLCASYRRGTHGSNLRFGWWTTAYNANQPTGSRTRAPWPYHPDQGWYQPCPRWGKPEAGA